MNMKKKLLEIIVCPICHEQLCMNLKETELICKTDNISFPIKRGIPVFLKKKLKQFNTIGNNI